MIVQWYWALIDWFWSAICHQIPARCFAIHCTVLGRSSLPLCARCTGIWFGSFATLCYALLERGQRKLEHPPLKMMILLYVCAIPMFADGLLSYSGSHSTSNMVRYLTGVPFGVLISALALPIRYQYGVSDEASVCQRPPKPILANWREAARLYGVAAGIGLMLLAWNPSAIILPAVSAVGALSVLAGVSWPLARLAIRMTSRTPDPDKAIAIYGHALAGVMAIVEVALLRAAVYIVFHARQ